MGRLRTRARGHGRDRGGDVVEPGGPKEAKANLGARARADKDDRTPATLNGNAQSRGQNGEAAFESDRRYNSEPG